MAATKVIDFGAARQKRVDDDFEPLISSIMAEQGCSRDDAIDTVGNTFVEIIRQDPKYSAAIETEAMAAIGDMVTICLRTAEYNKLKESGTVSSEALEIYEDGMEKNLSPKLVDASKRMWIFGLVNGVPANEPFFEDIMDLIQAAIAFDMADVADFAAKNFTKCLFEHVGQGKTYAQAMAKIQSESLKQARKR